ncbi:hypothetical protein [Moritella sp. F3]|uniref:hypothetical protein n=1 Tax=Moritella sp. F3 TaxID=2718882 RepID=UPI0018E0CF22|nr:hypothetical protein [Moritella sp. F3]GIC77614.1 hypothetical protein FMO001_23410 [Moritella sp. F1]GIC82027.1 hypothetical protein FMO003_23080 [Moritella sp. F3]
MTSQMHYYYENGTRILTFDAENSQWKDTKGKTYPIYDGHIPLINESQYESLPGFFMVEVIDPLGKRGYFKLTVENEIICRGDTKWEPGVNIDVDIEGAKLKANGLLRPSMDFNFITDCISYGFNEGNALKDEIELSPWFEEDEEEQDELVYKWRIQ